MERLSVGMKVVYIGADDDQVRWGGNDDPRKCSMMIGAVYTVAGFDVRSSHTKVTLAEHLDKRFNSISFEPVVSGSADPVIERAANSPSPRG